MFESRKKKKETRRTGGLILQVWQKELPLIACLPKTGPLACLHLGHSTACDQAARLHSIGPFARQQPRSGHSPTHDWAACQPTTRPLAHPRTGRSLPATWPLPCLRLGTSRYNLPSNEIFLVSFAVYCISKSGQILRCIFINVESPNDEK